MAKKPEISRSKDYPQIATILLHLSKPPLYLDGLLRWLGDQGVPGQLLPLLVPWRIVGTQSWQSLWRISWMGFCFWTWGTVSKESFSWSLRISSKKSLPYMLSGAVK